MASPLSHAAHSDVRWCALCATLIELRQRRRYSVRIVDADCGCGTLLIAAMRHAHALGFTAIEGRGIGGSPAMIGRARAAADKLRDSSIGVSFEVADMVDALMSEADFPADIVLWHGSRAGDNRPGVRMCLAASANRVIGDAPASADRAWRI